MELSGVSELGYKMRREIRRSAVGKSITPACLDADSVGYYMESLNRVPLHFIGQPNTLTCDVTVYGAAWTV